jgi:FtsH-binding integral membrane protein
MPKPVSKSNWNKKVSTLITLTFIASLVLTVASLTPFSDRTPPFTICLAVSVILLFVKRTADQLREKRT